MNKFKKKFTKIEFIKMLMIKSDMPRCKLCKYYWMNYKYNNNKLQSFAMNHFATRCKTCINSRAFIRMNDDQKKRNYWYEDNFKPLYEWEEFNSEGEKNG